LPSAVERIRLYEGRQPIFDHYNIEVELRKALGRRVELKSGGSLVIDQGEALTAIDVNTGSFVGKSDLEETVTRNNLEACHEVARQLRLRNIGGIIVIDFVDMDKEANRKKVWDEFHKSLANDRSRCNVTKISELGLVEMTRKRTRESLSQLLTETCPECDGSGVVKSTTTVANEVLREIRRVGNLVEADTIEIQCAPRVAELLLKYERDYIDDLEKKFQKKVNIAGTNGFKPDQYSVAGRSNELKANKSSRRSRSRKRGKKRSSDSASPALG
jgi:ribonuclease G